MSHIGMDTTRLLSVDHPPTGKADSQGLLHISNQQHCAYVGTSVLNLMVY